MSSSQKDTKRVPPPGTGYMTTHVGRHGPTPCLLAHSLTGAGSGTIQVDL
jgi:hypothetical protein